MTSTFGNGDAEARVAARYADFDWAEMHRVQQEQNKATAAAREVARLTGSIPAAEAPVDTTPVPEVGTVRLATDASKDYLVRLLVERTAGVTEEQVIAIVATLDEQKGQKGVSKAIDEAKALPKLARVNTAPAPTHAVPAGRYAVTGEAGMTVFVKVDRPTEGRWAGYTFVKVQVSDDEMRVSRTTEATLLRKIEDAGVQAAMVRYGLELGHCGHCGRTLTNEASREAGIGPVCSAKMGW